jgi:uncharacterized protein (TIGR03382 family)
MAGELVVNGGFETGNFSGWFVPPNRPPGPDASNFRVVTDGGAHSGNFYAQLSSTPLQFMSQILPTQAGHNYELSFWLRSPSIAPQMLTVRWEGAAIFNQGIFFQDTDWHRFTFPLHANITGSFLEFGQNVFPFEWHIDDISVVPIPAPSAAPLLLLGSAVALRRRRR